MLTAFIQRCIHTERIRKININKKIKSIMLMSSERLVRTQSFIQALSKWQLGLQLIHMLTSAISYIKEVVPLDHELTGIWIHQQLGYHNILEIDTTNQTTAKGWLENFTHCRLQAEQNWNLKTISSENSRDLSIELSEILFSEIYYF